MRTTTNERSAAFDEAMEQMRQAVRNVTMPDVTYLDLELDENKVKENDEEMEMSHFENFSKMLQVQQRFHLSEEYFTYQSLINHTLLVNYEIEGPVALQNQNNNTTAAMKFGSLVDTLLTNTSEFENNYVIVDNYKEPSEQVFKLFDSLYYHGFRRVEDFSENNDSILLRVARKQNFYNHYGETALLSKIKSLIDDYVQFCMYYQREIISTKEFNRASKCVETLRNSPITKWLFNNPKLKLFYQVVFLYDAYKVMFDCIAVDEINHIVYPIDLKTVSYPEYQFVKNSFYKFKYYRQAEMYLSVLKDYVATYTFDHEYTIEDMRFLVINADTLSPMFYKFPVIYNDEGELKIGNDKFVPNYRKIANDLAWYRRHPNVTYDTQTYYRLCQQNSENEDAYEIIDTNILTN